MNGDLLVFGGSATIEKGATVNGSAVLFGGSLTVNGTVNGDVADYRWLGIPGPAAHVSGNLTTVAASLDRADGSRWMARFTIRPLPGLATAKADHSSTSRFSRLHRSSLLVKFGFQPFFPC